MTLRSRRLAAFALLASVQLLATPVLAAPVQAQPDQVEPRSAAWTKGLQLNQAALQQVVGRPPAANGPEAASDLAVLLWLQTYRTPEMEASAWLGLYRDPAAFSRALGVDMVKQIPTLSSGITAFIKPVDQALGVLKATYRRQRPFQAHPQIHPCLPLEDTYSFPSGHSTWYRTAAELLADLVPERRDRLIAVGLHGGAARVMCGMHYPSDVEAGQRLGAEAARQIIQSEQWQAFRRDPAVQKDLQLLRSLAPERLPLLVR